MSSLHVITSVNYSPEAAVERLKQSLSRRGLRVLETFDLQAARLGLADCPCPYHGTDECDCQMVVLLVYGEATAPIALTLHGNNGQTWISLANDNSHDPAGVLQAAIGQALRGIRGN